MDNSKRRRNKKRRQDKSRKKLEKISEKNIVVNPVLTSVFKKIGVPEEKPFQLDSYQIEAIENVLETDCLVTAPTGSGKTIIAINSIKRVFENHGKCWYASPLKALTNDIYGQFKKEFGDHNVGILTGDVKENPDAPIIVGTTEILRNQLYDSMCHEQDLELDYLVLDEFHYLGDRDRGVVWEEVLIYLPEEVNILMLSATVQNAKPIAKWLSDLRNKECKIVNKIGRNVPLYPLFLHPKGKLVPFMSSDRKSMDFEVQKFVKHEYSRYRTSARKLPNVGAIIEMLRENNLLPAIFFMKSRADCDRALHSCDSIHLKNNPDKNVVLNNRINDIIQDNKYLKKHNQLYDLRNKAVGSHHSGQLIGWKVVVEKLMSEGHLDAVFATSTVAAGVNFPARTVVVLNSDRYNGSNFIPLNSTEYHQMTGRAGRRGKDNIGFVLMLHTNFMDLEHISKIYNKNSNNVNSQVHVNFSMILNLLQSHKPNEIKTLLHKSFAAYQQETLSKGKFKRTNTINQTNLWDDFIQHLDFLKKYNYVDEYDKLTYDGNWTSQLRVDQPLILSEGFRRKILPIHDPVTLSAMISIFIFDKDVKEEYNIFTMVPKQFKKSLDILQTDLIDFINDLDDHGFHLQELYATPAVAIYRWMMGDDWDEITKDCNLTDGDFSRLILRTIDNLRHIGHLDYVFPGVKNTVFEAIGLLAKEPVI